MSCATFQIAEDMPEMKAIGFQNVHESLYGPPPATDRSFRHGLRVARETPEAGFNLQYRGSVW